MASLNGWTYPPLSGRRFRIRCYWMDEGRKENERVVVFFGNIFVVKTLYKRKNGLAGLIVVKRAGAEGAEGA